MNFQDIKEKFMEAVTPYIERLKESDAWQKISEQYESLSPRNQKIAKATGAALMVLGYFGFIYWMFLGSASENIETFERNQSLIRELISVGRKVNSAPKIPPAIPVDSLKMSVETEIANMRLLPEQKVAVTPASFTMGSLGPKDLIADGLTIELKQLTISQVMDMAYNLQAMNASPAKLLGLEIRAFEKDSHYFNAKYSLAMFSLPEPKAPPEPASKKRPARRRGGEDSE